MRPIFFAFASCLVSILVACEDNNEVSDPEWIDEWIAEVEVNQYCDFCEIYRYEFEGAHYYELYSPIFSCFPCQVHDRRGALVDSTFNIQDYIVERKDKTLIYKKE